MTGESMSVLRDEIAAQMRSRSTDELVKIWQEHDLSQWSELALDVVRQILQERLGEVPASQPARAGEKAGDRQKNPGKGFLWGWLIVNFAGWALAVLYVMMFQDRNLMDVLRSMDTARYVPDRVGEIIGIIGIPLGISLAFLQAIQVTRWKLPALPWVLATAAGWVLPTLAIPLIRRSILYSENVPSYYYDNLLLIYAGVWLLIGALVGTLQALAMGSWMKRPGLWTLASGLGTLAFGMVFIAMLNVPVGYLNAPISYLVNPQTRPTISFVDMWLVIAGLTPVAAALLIGLPTSFVFERYYAAPEMLPSKSPE